jgi:hypothetical protein
MTKQKPDKMVVQTDDLINVLKYLASRPYSEVAELIKKLEANTKPFEEKREDNEL